MKVSVIIPARDAAATIDETLASLCAQTIGTWEALVIDDGSADQTAAIIEQWVAKEPRISLLRQERLGVCAARNAGIHAASGEALLFLDADDWLLPGHLQRMTGLLAADAALDVVHCGWARVAADGKREVAGRVVELLDPFAVLARSWPFAIHCCLLRRAAVVALGGFDPDLATCEDWDLWQRLARPGARFGAIDAVLALYRMRPGSSTAQIGRLLQDGLTVIRRGFAPDRRVAKALPFHENGERVGLSEALYHYTILIAGRAIGAGADPVKLLPALAGERVIDIDPARAASALFETVPIPSGKRQCDWPLLWPAASAPLDAFLAALERHGRVADLKRRVLRALERLILDAAAYESLTIGRTHGLSIEVTKAIADQPVPEGVERLHCRVEAAGRRVGSVQLPVLAEAVKGEAIADSIASDLALPLIRGPLGRRLARDPRLWLRLMAIGLEGRAFAFARSPVDARNLRERAENLARRAASRLVRESLLAPLPAEPVLRAPPVPVEADPFGSDHWERMFERPDPWRQTSRFERSRTAQILSLLPPKGIGRVVELGCGEGHLTVQLARMAGQVTAVDFSRTALLRAEGRCAGLDNVRFERMDLRRDALPGPCDLMLCADSLHGLDGPKALQRLARRLAESVVPGGWLVLAHSHLLADDPGRSGFDWDYPVGAEAIGQAFAATAPWRLVKELRTVLYRIQLFRHATSQHPVPRLPQHVVLPLAASPDPDIERRVLWGGCVRRRAEAMATETTEELPILRYAQVTAARAQGRRVTPDQFDRQLLHLRRHGYRGIDLAEWRAALAAKRGVAGRAVLLTFDGGYRDFLTEAWPILQRHGFPATLCVVADRVGGSGTWDKAAPQPAPLLTWRELRRLEAEGVGIASLAASHRPLTALPPHEILREGQWSRQVLERELGRKVTDIAYPFGDSDPVVRRIMATCGYESGLGGMVRRSWLGDDGMDLPRLEVTGGLDLDGFHALLGRAGGSFL